MLKIIGRIDADEFRAWADSFSDSDFSPSAYRSTRLILERWIQLDSQDQRDSRAIRLAQRYGSAPKIALLRTREGCDPHRDEAHYGSTALAIGSDTWQLKVNTIYTIKPGQIASWPARAVHQLIKPTSTLHLLVIWPDSK